MERWLFLIIAVVALGLAIWQMKKQPRRIINGFLIEGGVISLLIWVFYGAEWGSVSYQTAYVLMMAFFVMILIIGLALLVDFAMVVRREGMSKPNLLPLLFGLASLAVSAIGYQSLTGMISGSQWQVFAYSLLTNLVLYIPFALGGFLIYSWVYPMIPKRMDVKYIIVLGCRIRANGEPTPLLRGRLDKALEAYNRGGRQARFIVSGGKGSDEIVSEARAMADYLISKGVPESSIILEDKSTTTRENLLFSQKLMDSPETECLICTSNYHVLRAVLLARALGVNGQGVGGKTALYYLPTAFFREYIAVIFRYKLMMVIYMLLAVVSAYTF